MFFTALLALFIALPLCELGLLLKVGEFLGWRGTIALVVVTGVVGVTLARLEGTRVLINIQRDLAQGRMPAPYLLDGVMILLAGALLITPGLITDTVGFLLLIPVCRAAVKQWLRRKLESKLRVGAVDVTHWQW